jgi:hypothetical protein
VRTVLALPVFLSFMARRGLNAPEFIIVERRHWRSFG